MPRAARAAPAGLAGRAIEPGSGQEPRLVETELVPSRGLSRAELDHVVVEARDPHPAPVVMQQGQDAAQRVDRVNHRAAVTARMQVDGGAVQGYLGVAQAAQL